MIIGCYNKSVIITYIGILSAIWGIANSDNPRIALAFLIIAGICDLFDGPVARLCKSRTPEDKEFGKQIDSLADVIISIALTVCIITRSFSIHIVYTYSMCGVYALAGVIRLAWYNITELQNGYYTGLPVTYIALIFPVSFIILDTLSFDNFQMSLIYNAMMVLMAFAFVANIKVKKPTKVWYYIFSVLAIFTLTILIIG